MVSKFHRHLLLLASSSAALIFSAQAQAADVLEAEATASADADQASAYDDGEIVVSARRRDERAQDVPISLSTVGGDVLQTTSLNNLTEIAALVPSLNIRGANPRNMYLNIRGLGSNSTQNDGLEIGIGTYVDDVFYGRVGSSQFDLIDLEQMEVLRGPQGTLFGKNTTAGAINITTRAPSFEPELRGEVSVGEDSYRQIRATASAPLIADRVALRLTGSHRTQDGQTRNAFDGQKVGQSEDTTLRAQLLILPTDNLKIRVIGDYSEHESSGTGSAWIGTFTKYENGATIANNILDRVARLGYEHPNAFANPFDRIVNLDAPTTSKMDSAGVSVKIDLDLGWADLTSITAARRWNWTPQNDTDGTGLDINPKGGTANKQRQFSQEIRLASQGKRTIDYVVGLYYFQQKIDALSQYRLGADYAAWNNPAANRALADFAYTGFQADSAAEPRTKSYAAFGQATWNVSDALTVTGGLRFTHEAREASYHQYMVAGNDVPLLENAADRATVNGWRQALYPDTQYFRSTKDDALTGQLNIAYKFAPDALIFASYSRGAKSGGVNVGTLPAGVSGLVKQEKVDACEIGLKTQFWDRKITANFAGFWTEVSDYQAAIAEQIGETTSVRRYISNIPGVRSRGFEADIAVRPSQGLSLTAAFAYTDAVYKGYTNAQVAPEKRNLSQWQDLRGVAIPNISKFTYALAADYRQPVNIGSDSELYLRADYNHRSGFYTSDTYSAYGQTPGYGVLNARIGLRLDGDRWDLSLWARNLTDKEYFTSVSAATTGLITAGIGAGRQVGSTLRFNF
jgi:iron complex outermembrane receptor protein